MEGTKINSDDKTCFKPSSKMYMIQSNISSLEKPQTLDRPRLCIFSEPDLSYNLSHLLTHAHKRFANCTWVLYNYCVFYVHVTLQRNEFLFNKTNRCTNFQNLFCQETLHVSGSSSAHHQEFSNVHSALVYVMQGAWGSVVVKALRY